MDGDDRIFRAKDGNALRFFSEAVRNNFQSERHGQPIFDTVLYVDVITPGQSESIPRFELERVYSKHTIGLDGQPVIERYEKYEMFREQIEAYKSQETGDGHEGTPISQWANIDAGTAATLKAAGVFTVEMLAAVNDGNLQKLGLGGRVLRDQAQGFLQSRTFGLPTTQMSAENANMKQELERLTGELAARDATIADLSVKLAAAAMAVPAQPAPPPPAVDAATALGLPAVEKAGKAAKAGSPTTI